MLPVAHNPIKPLDGKYQTELDTPQNTHQLQNLRVNICMYHPGMTARPEPGWTREPLRGGIYLYNVNTTLTQYNTRWFMVSILLLVRNRPILPARYTKRIENSDVYQNYSKSRGMAFESNSCSSKCNWSNSSVV